MKSKLEIVVNILGLLVAMPIWFYLQYQILIRVQATELMMFLFWIYVPVVFLVSLLAKILGK